MKGNREKISIPKRIYPMLEEEAVNLHIDLELSIPVKAREVINKLGYILIEMSKCACKENNMLKECRFGTDGERRDGLSYYDPNLGTSVIWLNDIDTYYEEHDDFTLLHEVGHIRLGHKGESELANRMANYYASYVLVPTPLIEFFHCSTDEDIRKKFGVSKESAKYCGERYERWRKIPGPLKPYEKRLLDYYRTLCKGGIDL